MFSTAEKISIAKILGWTVVGVDLHLITNSAVIDADIEAAVRDLIGEFEGLPVDTGLEIFPTESNFGAKISNTLCGAKRDIVSGLESLLNIQPAASNIYQTMLERG